MILLQRYVFQLIKLDFQVMTGFSRFFIADFPVYFLSKDFIINFLIFRTADSNTNLNQLIQTVMRIIVFARNLSIIKDKNLDLSKG